MKRIQMAANRFGIPVALSVCLMASFAWADEPKPYEWKVGELLEVEFKHEEHSVESSRLDGKEEPGFKATRVTRLVYVDRVDEVVKGRILRLTRHFKVVQLVEDGRERPSLLQGRNVTLKRDPRGEVRATWVGGGSLPGGDFFAAELGPWPDVNRDWELSKGTRKGTIAKVPTLDWKRPSGTPHFVATALEEFGLPTVAKGAWSITVAGANGPFGTVVKGKVSLQGHESEETDDGLYVSERADTVTVNLVVRKASSEELPGGQAPPEPVDETLEDEMSEDEEEATPEDDGDPLPEDDDDPIPAPDEEDPLPDDEDSNQED